MKHSGLILLGVTTMLAGIAPGFDLAGNWHVSGIGIPRGLAQNRDVTGVVIGLSGNHTFDSNDGTLSIDALGNITGFVGGVITGSATAAADGVVSMTLNTPDPVALTLHMNTTSDLMISSHTEADFSELLVLAKAPDDALLADAAGTWWVVTLETPASVDAQFNADGKMIGFAGPTASFMSRSTLVIDPDGNYNYNGGEDTGVVGVAADGTMTLTSSDPLVAVMQQHMSVLKDVMIGAMAESGQRNLTIMVKTSTINNWEATGHWAFDRMSVPATLPLTRNTDGFVTNIDGFNFLDQENGAINFTLDGKLSGMMEGPFAGYSTGSSNGLIQVFHGEPAPFVPAVSIGGDFLIGVDGGGSANELSLLIGLRSVRPLEIGVLAGTPLTILWVPGPGRTLQDATNVMDWTTVIGSGSMSSYVVNPATDGSHHFYRIVESN
ncbi:MAG TPA: hypothetical protein VFY13_08650 [Luteolibacter sp.]|nr:hypothetical protein [Luteolibacter sp.]